MSLVDLDLHSKWMRPPMSRPPIGTVLVSGRCRKQTTRNYLKLQKKVDNFNFKYLQLLLIILNPRSLSFFATASTCLKVFRLADCIPLFLHQSRALYQFCFLKRKSFQIKIKTANFKNHSMQIHLL